jgi:hypothetical protein
MSVANNILGSYSKLDKKDDDLVKIVTQDLNNIIDGSSKVFVYDFPGKFAFYSDFNVIPADGLVADETYFKEISEMDFSNYLRKNNVEYVILPANFDSSGVKDFMALTVNNLTGKSPKYFLKNSYNKKIVSSINLSDFAVFKVFGNPVKTWQPYYNNIIVYKLKKENVIK